MIPQCILLFLSVGGTVNMREITPVDYFIWHGKKNSADTIKVTNQLTLS